jgi:hypothetical protein
MPTGRWHIQRSAEEKMRDFDSFLNVVAGALAGRRVYAWLWLQGVIWSMLFFALTGPAAPPQRVRGVIVMAMIGSGIFAALAIRAMVTGVLFEYLFSKSPDLKRPNMEMRVWIRYVIPVLCFCCLVSRWFFDWFLE